MFVFFVYTQKMCVYIYIWFYLYAYISAKVTCIIVEVIQVAVFKAISGKKQGWLVTNCK